MSTEDPPKPTFLWKIADTIFGNNAVVDEQRFTRLQACSQLERAYQHCELRRRHSTNGNSSIADNNAVTTQNSIEKVEATDELLQNSRSGIKISRFFNWGITHERSHSTNSAMRDSTTKNIQLEKDKNSHDQCTRQGSEQGLLELGVCNMQNPVNQSASISIEKDVRPVQQLDSSTSSCQRELHAVWTCRALTLGCGSELVHLKRCFEVEGISNPTCFYDVPLSSLPQDNSISTHDCRFYQRKVATCVTEQWKNLHKRRQKFYQNDDTT